MSGSGHLRPPSGWLAPRHPGDAVRVVIAVLVLVVSAVFIHHDRVGVLETDVFRVFNDLPAALLPVLWVVMQAGNFLAIPVAAVIVAATRRYRLATEILLAGVGVWLLAKEVKNLIPRGRPASLLSDVHIHGAAAGGRGFLSGHAAVTAAIVTLISPYLGRRTRRAVILVVVFVCVARMYVGAHLPLDVIAGAALGWGAASAVHLLLGTPTGRPSVARLRTALAGFGFRITEIVQLSTERPDAARYRMVTDEGRSLFVKVLARERRDRDLLYRGWLRVTRQSNPSRAPTAQVEHEALLSTVARLSGVRTPCVLVADRFGNGAGLVVREWVEARRMDEPPLHEAALADTACNVATLHRAGIAHRHLTPWTLLVDGDDRSWLVGFDQAQLRASQEELDDDDAQLATIFAALVGPEPATRIIDAQRVPAPS
jgi:undecaprenyl-diphosphatase